MRYLLFGIIITFFACEAPVPPEPRGDKLAKSLCGCTAQLITLNQQAATATDSLSFRNIATEFEKARACAAGLGIKPNDRAALELALTTHCPALAAHKDLLPELLGQ